MANNIDSRNARKRLVISICITLIFVFIEILAGIFSKSLALLTDAAHNFTDVLALGLSWWAIRLATQPPHAKKTFGNHRAGILVALVNSTTLAVIAVGIFYEAYRRFLSPPEINAGVMTGVAAVAVVVNLVTALLVKHGSENDLNMRSAFVHLMGDVISTAGAMVAGVIIYFSGLSWIDPLVSILIGFLILWNAWGIVKESIDILMEATPADIDMEDILAEMKKREGVVDVHDLHIWSINQSMRSLSAHIVTRDITISAGGSIQMDMTSLLKEKYNIHHATLQLECVDCSPTCIYCDPTIDETLKLNF